MSATSRKRSEDFLKLAGQFKLGALVTEASHPVTADLSEVAKRDIAQALRLLFEVDGDVVKKFREFAESGRAEEIADTVVRALNNGGRIFFTGCGATGRLSIQLDSIWRDFWQRLCRRRGNESSPPEKSEPSPVGHYKFEDFENRTCSVMAGGDFALIRSVEGFEDFTEFGKKQIGDVGVCDKDVVFAITEGGETSFVIGTAWKGVEVGAKVYFVYNNPDDVLRQHVERSRQVIEDARIEKINLTTGPMAISGSTRMQATSIQLCVMMTVLEMVVRELAWLNEEWRLKKKEGGGGRRSATPQCFLAALEEMHATLKSPEVLSQLAKLVAMEESVYRAGGKNNYFADLFGIDVLTDTTERSPTYCTPPFRKFDDVMAAESWAFLFLPDEQTPAAWRRILKREPRCVEWSEGEIRSLVSEEKFARTLETVGRISAQELMRFKVGLDGLPHRAIGKGDSAVAIVGPGEAAEFCCERLESAAAEGARTGLICFEAQETRRELIEKSLLTSSPTVVVPVPETDFLLDGVTRVGVKMILNALSTCTMVRLGRVMGNTMIWVVASNLKLIDRATRYIQRLTGLSYEQANHLLFEVIEYVGPRMKTDQSYPPVVGLAVMRHRHGVGNEEAERRLVLEAGG
jgi:N-acetylmuramic acid 6-phosphate etherase